MSVERYVIYVKSTNKLYCYKDKYQFHFGYVIKLITMLRECDNCILMGVLLATLLKVYQLMVEARESGLRTTSVCRLFGPRKCASKVALDRRFPGWKRGESLCTMNLYSHFNDKRSVTLFLERWGDLLNARRKRSYKEEIRRIRVYSANIGRYKYGIFFGIHVQGHGHSYINLKIFLFDIYFADDPSPVCTQG